MNVRGLFGWRSLRRYGWLALAVIAGSPAQTQLLPTPAQSPTVPTGSPVGTPPPGGPTADRANDEPATNVDGYPLPVSGERLQAVEVEDEAAARNRATVVERNPRLKPPAAPNEFERFVERVVGRKLPRFGADLLLPSSRDYSVPATATVPPGYLLNVGDTVAIAMTGSIEGSVDREIDTDGRVFLPRVGSIRLAGVRYGDLKDTIARAIGIKYRNFTVNVGVRQLRGVRVYVTGFANNPGAYSVNSLSTMVNAVLAAGGPSAGGSFRSVKLYRNNELVSDFDLYDLLLRGDRTGDALLQNEDVLFIPPVGEQIAVTGAVNAEAVFEIRPGETLERVLSYAGGANTLSDMSRLLVYRLSNADTIGAEQITRAQATATPAAGGDIVQLVSQGSLQRSVDRQSVVVRIEGEVQTPGTYYMPANTPLAEVLARAGGLTRHAFVYGTRFERTSVRRQQRESFDEAIQQLEIAVAAAPLTADGSIDAGTRATQAAGAREVLARLREAEPDGRIVLGLTPTSTTLPGDFVLENNDRILIPPRPSTVGVFGAVYRPASFVRGGGKSERVSDYLDRAGGALRSGDRGQTFVVRANGEVISRRRGALKAITEPGDVIFVPVKIQNSSLWAKIRDISTIAFQFGVSAAAIVALSR